MNNTYSLDIIILLGFFMILCYFQLGKSLPQKIVGGDYRYN